MAYNSIDSDSGYDNKRKEERLDERRWEVWCDFDGGESE